MNVGQEDSTPGKHDTSSDGEVTDSEDEDNLNSSIQHLPVMVNTGGGKIQSKLLEPV